MADPERTDADSNEESEAADEPWAIAAVAEAVSATPEVTVDIALGSGHLFDIDPKQQRALELYPTAFVVRLTGKDLQVTLYRAAPPTIEESTVLFATQQRDTTLRLHPSGAIDLVVSAEAEAAASSPVPQSASQPEAEPRERLTLSGRVGQTPRFRTTPKGTLIAQFPVAVRDADQQTTWHRVVAFGERAEKLRETVDKGQAVEIIGYKHTRQSRRRDGTPITIEEVYATVVRPVTGR